MKYAELGYTKQEWRTWRINLVEKAENLAIDIYLDEPDVDVELVRNEVYQMLRATKNNDEYNDYFKQMALMAAHKAYSLSCFQ